MKAIVLVKNNSTLDYEILELEKPKPGDDQVLINNKAFSFNPIDLKTLRGNKFSEKLVDQKPSILGWDAAGVIEKAGKKVSGFKTGDAVMGMINFPEFGHTFADYVLANPEDVVQIPTDFSYEKAAALPLAGLTAFQALKYHCKPAEGKRLLLHAGGGGVGHLAIQIAKALGFYVITTASASKKDFVKECGADQFINYKEQVFQDVIEKPVDAVFDLIGGDYIDKSLKVLKKGGTIVSIPSSGNAEVKEKAERAGCQGVRFRVQTNQNDLMELVKLFNKPGANIFVGEQFDWGQVDRAFSILENGHVKGKIVLSTGKD